MKKFYLFSFLLLRITLGVEAQTFPCKQYILRQTVNPGTVTATTELGIASRSSIPSSQSYITPLCTFADATYNQQYNGLAYYNGRLFAWVQYGANTGTGGEAIVEFKTNCTAPTTTAINTSNDAVINSATVDPNTGIYYGGSGNGNTGSTFIINRVSLTGATPVLLSNLVVTLPSGTTFPSNGIGDISYVGGTENKIYFWLNTIGLFSIPIPASTTTAVTATKIGSTTNRILGSTYWLSNDPGFLYGYGSASGSTSQDRLMKVSLSTGLVSELSAGGGATTSQSDGDGCPTADFEVTLSGNIFVDSNGSIDGVDGTSYSAGDLKVNLLNSAGVVVATANVAPDGTYSFVGPAPGNYSIQINTVAGTIGQTPPAQVLPSGYANTGDEIGTVQGSTVNGVSEVFTVGGENISNINFGIGEVGTISGSVLVDTDNNNSGDAPQTIATTISLYNDVNNNGIYDPGTDTFVSSTTTNTSTGAYSFANIPLGNYVLVETDPTGYYSVLDIQSSDGDVVTNTITNDNTIPVTLVANETDANNNFVDETGSSTISGTVWEDNTDNNKFEKDAGVSGVIISLEDAFGNVIATQTTGPGGTYSFTNVPPGDYFIVIGSTPKPLQYDNDDTNDGSNDTEENNTGSATTTSGFVTSDGRIPVSVTGTGSELDGSNDFISSSFTNNNAPFPVKLVSFTAREMANSVILEWKTSLENYNEGFEVYHSFDSKTFTKIGFVKGINSKEASAYEFEHISPIYGENYYRLIQLDFDQTKNKSKIISVSYLNPDGVILSYPNPTSSGLKLKGLRKNDIVTLSDMNGRLLNRIEVVMDGELDILTLQNRQSGIYFVKIARNGLTVNSSKIIKE